MLNHELKDLIKKYKAYKSKKRRKVFFRLFFLFGLTALGWWYFNGLKTDKKRSVNEANMTKSDKHSSDTADVESNETIVKDRNRQELNEKNETFLEETVADVEQKSLKDSAKIRESNANRFQLKVTTKKRTEKQLLKNYERKSSYSSALALSEYYYSKKRYDDAIKWAVKASKINRYEVKPWLIYAKSKKRLGDIEKAKMALEIFLKTKESKEVRELLNTL
jgi:tetratricopeptide (TPR) repeat protein